MTINAGKTFVYLFGKKWYISPDSESESNDNNMSFHPIELFINGIQLRVELIQNLINLYLNVQIFYDAQIC